MIAGINEILSENSALTTLIGSDKIFPMIVNEDTELPYLATSLARVGTDDIKGNAAGFDYGLVNVNVHASNYDDLETISTAVRTAMDNLSFTTDAGYTFTRISFSTAFDRPDLFTTDRPSYARSVQFNAIVKR